MENYFFSENKEGENPQKLKKVKGGKWRMGNGKLSWESFAKRWGDEKQKMWMWG